MYSKLTGRRYLNFSIDPKSENHSARRLNQLIPKGKRTYLEIGVSEGFTLEKVKASEIFGVDPNPQFHTLFLPKNVHFFKVTSDEFFQNIDKNQKFDLIFLDGLHHADFLFRDFLNALKHLAIGGWILIDDVIPCDSASSLIPEELSLKTRNEMNLNGQPWHGDVYQIIGLIKRFEKLFEWYIIIYPNNPQMLIRPSRLFDIEEFLIDAKVFWEKMGRLSYQEFFSDDMIKSLPLCLEELLLKKLIGNRPESVKT
jgi:hypothetical protein